MLQDWNDEQLNLGIAVMSVLTLLVLLIIVALWVSPTIAAPLGLAQLPATATPQPVSTLPPTWTPIPTQTATSTRTPRPTDTPTATPTNAPTETPTPDVAATLTALPTNTATFTPEPTPTSPPPPPPPSGGSGGSGGGGGSSQPAPTQPPTATPTPLYVLRGIAGAPDCSWVGFFGNVYNPDGSRRAGVTVRLFNEYGFETTVVTEGDKLQDHDANWQVFLDGQPREGLAGLWHLVLLENGERVSDEIGVNMAGTCDSGQLTKFKVDWQRSVP